MAVSLKKGTIKHAAPYALAIAAIASAGLWIWEKVQTGLPEGVVPVTNFDIDRYLGEWYEIARFDYRFEKGLKNVTACYFRNNDGSIKVVNRGQDSYTGQWEESTGKAKFVSDEHTGRLKVSFFGPFYAAYTIMAIDDEYQYALIAGNNLEYLWLLSRRPVMPDDIKAGFLQKAAAAGYNTAHLLWTKQNQAG